MKKLLSILAAVGLTATASTAVVACTTTVKAKDLDGLGNFNKEVKMTLNKDAVKLSAAPASDVKDDTMIDLSGLVLLNSDKKDDTKDGATIKTENVIAATFSVKYSAIKGKLDSTDKTKLTKNVSVKVTVKANVASLEASKSKTLKTTVVETADGTTVKGKDKTELNIKLPAAPEHKTIAIKAKQGSIWNGQASLAKMFETNDASKDSKSPTHTSYDDAMYQVEQYIIKTTKLTKDQTWRQKDNNNMTSLVGAFFKKDEAVNLKDGTSLTNQQYADNLVAAGANKMGAMTGTQFEAELAKNDYAGTYNVVLYNWNLLRDSTNLNKPSSMTASAPLVVISLTFTKADK